MNIVTQILANLESQIYDKDTFVIKNKDEFKHFFLIKHGSVKLFSSNYTYMYDLEKGSFFGEYNILYGLYSNIFYRTQTCNGKSHYVMIFRIEAETFMSEICKDIDSFNHINKIAV